MSSKDPKFGPDEPATQPSSRSALTTNSGIIRRRPDPVVTFHESVKRASRTTTKLREGAERQTMRGDWTAEEAPTAEIATPRPVTGGIALESVPRLVRRADDLVGLPLDARDGFLMALIDGETTVQTLIDVAAMPPSEVVEILTKLVELGVVVVA